MQVTATLRHPILRPLLESGAAGGLLFNVMPCVDVESLRARFDRAKKPPIEDASHIATAVASTLDARTDIYSLGAVTYEVLTGEAPPTGSASQVIDARMLTERPRGIRSSLPNAPAHVEGGGRARAGQVAR